MKKTAIAASLLTALLSMHNIASACVGSSCYTDVYTDVTYHGQFVLNGSKTSPDGIFTQKNTGNATSSQSVRNVITPTSGQIDVSSFAAGNEFSYSATNLTSADRALLSQSNSGAISASANLYVSANSHPETVTLGAGAFGNTASFSAKDNSLSTISAAQCNNGNVTSRVDFQNDPKFLSTNASAVGNSISVFRNKP